MLTNKVNEIDGDVDIDELLRTEFDVNIQWGSISLSGDDNTGYYNIQIVGNSKDTFEVKLTTTRIQYYEYEVDEDGNIVIDASTKEHVTTETSSYTITDYDEFKSNYDLMDEGNIKNLEKENGNPIQKLDAFNKGYKKISKDPTIKWNSAFPNDDFDYMWCDNYVA